MRPRTPEEMDTIMRSLARDCMTLCDEAALRQTDLAKLLGTTRVTISKLANHMKNGGPANELPISGKSSATLFMNLLIVRRLLELALASGELPPANAHQRQRWVGEQLADSLE